MSTDSVKMDTGIPLFFPEIQYLLLETIPLEIIMRVSPAMRAGSNDTQKAMCELSIGFPLLRIEAYISRFIQIHSKGLGSLLGTQLQVVRYR